MTLEQLAAFEATMAARPGGVYPMLFRVMAEAGLRPGEARGLKVEDIDCVTRTLHVVRALRKDGRVKATKTKRTRDVELSAALVAALRQYVKWLTAQALAKGRGEPVWVFPTAERHEPVDQRTMRRSFKAACKRAGLRGFRPYDLRAACASQLLSLGAEITYVAQQLGNSAPVILRFYAKYLPNKSRRWVDSLVAARQAVAERFGTQPWNLGAKMLKNTAPQDAEIPDIVDGEPWWDRTTDPLIKRFRLV